MTRDTIDALVLQAVTEQHALIERACEQALQHGVYGVLVLTGPDGRNIASEHPHVPYGNLYEAPTTAATTEALIDAFTTWAPR